MHPITLPQDVQDRVIARRGKLHIYEEIDPKRTALVVIDMQNIFLEPGALAETPIAREIVPSINRLAEACRAAGMAVAWVQSAITDQDGEDYWPGLLAHLNTKERAGSFLEWLKAGSHGHAIWSELDFKEDDLYAKKNRYSAFLPGAGPLGDMLRERNIDTVIITGTLTNVCCESSARDAMMTDFKTIMVSDGNACLSDQEHISALSNHLQVFGDVYSTDELIDLL
ncbi:MAG: cysteine hydrolase [Rhodospirillaceae bacterium]|jgi:ureidoacrylate peracid hydrolase|nr:cysteine hydrolase [Rhodospirillaceae bacterium]MBT4589624.1 cysteine hydrolase [Rhodospirillaceae bacterium]